MAALAVLPVHAIYAGFVLREAWWRLCRSWRSGCSPRSARLSRPESNLGLGRRGGALRRAGGDVAHHGFRALGGLGPVQRGGRRLAPQGRFWCGLSPPASSACRGPSPPGWNMIRRSTQTLAFFEYNFSWTVHHYMQGNTRASEFYTWHNMPEIVRMKVKSLHYIALTSTMILGLPMVLGFWRQLTKKDGIGRQTTLLVATIFVVFVLATLKRVSDITQVMQLGRYYSPVFAIALPAGVAGFGWLDSLSDGRRVAPFVAVSWLALVWADPTWAYDATWLSNRDQVHWPGHLEAATRFGPIPSGFHRRHGSWRGFPGSCGSRPTGQPF